MADNQETPVETGEAETVETETVENETVENETIVVAQAEGAAPAAAPGVTVTTVQAQPGEFLTPPGAGELLNVLSSPDVTACFDLASIEGATAELTGGGMLITLPEGGQIFLANFAANLPEPEAEAEVAPPMCLASGTAVDAGELLVLAGSSLAEIRTAAGLTDIAPGAGTPLGSGIGFRDFDPDLVSFFDDPDPLPPTEIGRTPPEPVPHVGINAEVVLNPPVAFSFMKVAMFGDPNESGFIFDGGSGGGGPVQTMSFDTITTSTDDDADPLTRSYDEDGLTATALWIPGFSAHWHLDADSDSNPDIWTHFNGTTNFQPIQFSATEGGTFTLISFKATTTGTMRWTASVDGSDVNWTVETTAGETYFFPSSFAGADLVTLNGPLSGEPNVGVDDVTFALGGGGSIDFGETFFATFDLGGTDDGWSIGGSDVEDGLTIKYTITDLPDHGDIYGDTDGDGDVELLQVGDMLFADSDEDPDDVIYIRTDDNPNITTDSFQYVTTDSDGLVSAPATVTIKFPDVTPTAVNDAYMVDEDALLVVGANDDILENDTDPNGDDLDVKAVNAGNSDITDGGAGDEDTVAGQITFTTAAGGTVVLDLEDGTFTYDQNGNFDSLGVGETDTDNFDYTITDGNSGMDTATVTITIDGVNDAPTANDDLYSVSEGVILNADSVLSHVDGSLGEPPDDTDPDANDDLDVLSVDNGDTVTSDGVNDADTVAGQITFTTAKGGTVVLDLETGTFTYDQNDVFDGLGVGDTDTDSFVYTITDDHGGTDTATVTITINGANDAPDARDDIYQATEDVVLNADSVLSHVDASGVTPSEPPDDSDPDGNDLDVKSVNAGGSDITDGGAGDDDAVAGQITFDTAKGGTVVITLEDGTYSYDQNGIFNSLAVGITDTDTFDYTITDGFGGMDTATVTIVVTGVNDAPDARDDIYQATEDVVLNADSVLSHVDASGVTPTEPPDDSDPDGDDLDVLSVNAGGSDITDGGAGDDDAVAGQITFDTAKGGTVVINLEAGTYSYDQNGIFNSLAVGITDTDTFDYTITDGNGGTDTATVTIVVTGVNDAPDARDDIYMATEDVVLNADGSVPALNGILNHVDASGVTPTEPPDDNDIDGDDLDVLSVNTGGSDITDGGAGDNDTVAGQITFMTALGGTVILNLADGTFTYDQNGIFDSLGEGDTGTDTFDYTITDGNGGTDTATVTILVEGQTDLVAFGAAVITNSSSSEAGEQILLLTITDADGSLLALTELDLFLQGQQGFTPFADPVEFDADEEFAVTLKYIQGDQQFNLTDFNLVDEAENPILTLQDSGNVQFSGGQGSGNDIAIYLLTPDGSGGFNISDPILGDIDDDDSNGTNEIYLNSDSPGTNFDLDLGILELEGLDTSDPTGASSDLFGKVELIDIEGSSNEDNTLTLSASDVLDATDNDLGITLDITGDAGDSVNLVDQDGGGNNTWTKTVDTGVLDTWEYGFGGTVIATVQIDDDLLVTANVV
jgi:hypothetical protein